MKLDINRLITIDVTGMPKAPNPSQLLDKDVRELYMRDNTPDKRKYIAECGVIYYLGDPKSPCRQRGLSDEESLLEAIDNLSETYMTLGNCTCAKVFYEIIGIEGLGNQTLDCLISKKTIK